MWNFSEVKIETMFIINNKWAAANMGLNARQAEVLNSAFVLLLSFCGLTNICASNPALRQAQNRYAQCQKTDNHKMNRQTKQMTENQRFAKLKEVQANAQSQRFCTTFNFAPTHPSLPTTQKTKNIYGTN